MSRGLLCQNPSGRHSGICDSNVFGNHAIKKVLWIVLTGWCLGMLRERRKKPVHDHKWDLFFHQSAPARWTMSGISKNCPSIPMDFHLGLESLELEWMFLWIVLTWGYQRDISQIWNSWHPRTTPTKPIRVLRCAYHFKRSLRWYPLDPHLEAA